MCFLVDDAYLFTGDAFRVDTPNLSLFNPQSTAPGDSLGFPGALFTMDEAKAQESLRKLQAMWPSDVTVFTAHYSAHESENLYFP